MHVAIQNGTHVAIQNRPEATARLLLDRGAEVNNDNNDLRPASLPGEGRIIRGLLPRPRARWCTAAATRSSSSGSAPVLVGRVLAVIVVAAQQLVVAGLGAGLPWHMILWEESGEGNNKKRTTLKRCSPGLRRLMRRSRTKTPKIRRLEGGWWDAHRGCWSGLRRTRRPRTKMPKIRRLGRKKAHAHQCMQAPKHLCRAPALRLPVAEHIPPSD